MMTAEDIIRISGRDFKATPVQEEEVLKEYIGVIHALRNNHSGLLQMDWDVITVCEIAVDKVLSKTFKVFEEIL
jgi:hypothetical protein